MNITGTDLVKAGMDETKMQALIDGGKGNATFYVHMGKADAYSWLQSRSGSVNAFDPDHMDADHYVEGTTGTGASNKYLTAAKCTMQKNNKYPILCPLRSRQRTQRQCL